MSKVRRRAHRDARGNVREAFAGMLRERWAGRIGWQHWSRVVDRIEAGEEIVVPGWQVRRFARAPMDGHVRLELDGSVTLVGPVRDGVHIVEWRPVA